MDHTPGSQHTTRLRKTSEQSVYCPLCHHMLQTTAGRSGSAEVVCEGCGFSAKLPSPELPCDPPSPQDTETEHEDPLDCWLAGDPIHPREVSDWDNLRHWARRRPVTAGIVTLSSLAVLVVAVVSTVLYSAESASRRQAERTLSLLEHQHADVRRQLQTSGRRMVEQQSETHRAEEACQATLSKLHDTEERLNSLQGRYDSLSQGREQVESAARLALARQMAAESAQRLVAQPAESLLLAERAMTYLNEHGEPVDAQLQQTLRDATALTGDQALRGHSGPVEAIAISSSGRWLLTGSVDTTARLWDLHAGPGKDPLVLRRHASPVRLAAISPDSRWAVTCDNNGTIVVWDLRASDPSQSTRILRAHQGKVHDLAISSDSRWLAVGGTGAFEEEDNSVRLWDLKSLASTKDDGSDSALAAEQPVVLRGHLGPVLAVAISPDCHWVVTGSEDETVRLFDLASDCPAASQVVLRQHVGPVTSIAISPDSRWMVTGSLDQTVRLWDLTTPQPGSRVTVLDGHEAGVHSVAISSTGRWVATAAHDQTVRLWNMNAVDPAATCVVLSGRLGDVGPIRFTPDGRKLVTGSSDGTVRVWNLETADPNSTPILLRGHCGPVASLAITPDSRKVLTGCRAVADRTDCLVRIWDLPIGRVLETARPIIAQRMNRGEQEQVLLEAANRTDSEIRKESDLQ